MSKEDLLLSGRELLEKLNRLEGDYLKRAAVILFHRNPEKWIMGAFVKIGFFVTDSDLRYQDEVHGSLLIQADRVIDLLYTKYLTAEISYDNVTRIGHYPFPKDAIREAVFNALVHQDFSAGIPVQISVYNDKLYISNNCIFPSDWTKETLFEKHRSNPLNPEIATTFYRAGYIESWERGIDKICTLCKDSGIENPEYTLHSNDIMILFRSKDGSQKSSQKILEIVAENETVTTQGIADILGVSRRTVAKKIAALQAEGKLLRIGPDKGGHWKINN